MAAWLLASAACGDVGSPGDVVAETREDTAAVDSAVDADADTLTERDSGVAPDSAEGPDTAADTVIVSDTVGDTSEAEDTAPDGVVDTSDASDTALDTVSDLDSAADTVADTVTEPDTTPPCEVVAVCCGDAVCIDAHCDGAPSVIASCAAGCAAGRCLDCDPACGVDDCGADGCGGTCGACESGEVCVDGTCACTLTDTVTCCDDTSLCLVDSCGVVGAAVASCPVECVDGACAGCEPDCGARTCGPNGCGGQCGPACEGGAVCLEGGCGCVETSFSVCCDGDRCAADSCGHAGDVIEPCTLGCEDGVCRTCAPNCAGRECGSDGCGGVCGVNDTGVCPGGATCLANGRCACAASTLTECCGEARCEVDACGLVRDVVEACAYGCDDDACLACEPDCDGRRCGPDGCHGVCGECGDSEVCLASGSCLPCVAGCGDRVCGLDACGNGCGVCGDGLGCETEGTCVPMVEAVFRAVTRQPNSVQTSLLGPSEVPMAGFPVVALAADGRPLGSGETGVNGRVRIVLSAPTSEAISLVVVASLADESGSPILSLVDGAGVGFPQSEGVQVDATRVWAWSFLVAPGVVDAGTLVIGTSDGSGAANLFMQYRDMRAEAEATYNAAGVPGRMPSLAVVWARDRSPLCLSCYFPEAWGPLVLTAPEAEAVTYDRFIWLAGTRGTPYQWTPSMAGHEFGHFVMEIYSRTPGEGGSHSWTSLLRPGLAWSEGFATFWGQWWLSQTALQPRFFTQQNNTQYWVNIDAIGVGSNGDDSNLFGGGFPPPQPHDGLDQYLNEAVVAAITWDLWDEAANYGEADAVVLGESLFTLLRAPAVLDPALNRGYETADFLDFLDAIRCGDAVSIEDLMPVILGFPYDDDPLCTE